MKYLLPLIFYCQPVCAQLIEYNASKHYPAPTPNYGLIEQSTNPSILSNNGIIDQEIKIDRKTRELTEKIAIDIASKNNWEVYKYSEFSSDVTPYNGKPVPYEKRPPHIHWISYVFIVDNQRLSDWKAFEESRRLPEGIDMNSTTNENITPHPSKYQDSLLWYMNIMSNYSSEHIAQYIKDISANNKTGIKNYESEMDKIQKKINSIQVKVDAESENQGNKNQNKYEKVRNANDSKEVNFRDHTLINMMFAFNESQTGTGILDQTTHSYLLPQNNLLIAGAEYAGITHNTLPIDLGFINYEYEGFPSVTDDAVILYKGWDIHPDKKFYNIFHSSLGKDKTNFDKVSIKKVKCDEIRSIVIHVQGVSENINTVIRTMDLKALAFLP